MKKYATFLLVILLVACNFSCSDDDDSVEDEATRYDLVIRNETDNEIIIYFNNTLDTRGFVNNGMIDAGEETIFYDLETEAPYLLRAVNNGEELKDFFYERPFSYDDLGEKTIIIDSPQL